MVNIFLAILFVLTVPNGIGVGVPHQFQDSIDLQTLGNPMFYNWLWDRVGEDNYTPMIWNTHLYYTNSEEIDLLMQDKSIFWLLINEPERTDQANDTPSDVATMLQTISTNNYACCGTVIGDKGFAWLDEFIVYGVIPPVWHIHIYTVNEDLVMWRLDQFKNWMEDNSVIRPIIISEINAYTSIENQSKILEFLPTLLDDPLVVGIYWFSAYYESSFPYANLLTKEGELTDLGELFKDLTE